MSLFRATGCSGGNNSPLLTSSSWRFLSPFNLKRGWWLWKMKVVKSPRLYFRRTCYGIGYTLVWRGRSLNRDECIVQASSRIIHTAISVAVLNSTSLYHHQNLRTSMNVGRYFLITQKITAHTLIIMKICTISIFENWASKSSRLTKLPLAHRYRCELRLSLKAQCR